MLLAGMLYIIEEAFLSIFFLNTLNSGYLLAWTKLPNMFFHKESEV